MLTALGCTLLVAAVLMGRSAVMSRRSESRDVPAELRAEIATNRGAVISQVRAVEVQLLEQARQLEAEIDTRRLILDRLIAEADARIEALEDRIDVAGRIEPQAPFRRAA